MCHRRFSGGPELFVLTSDSPDKPVLGLLRAKPGTLRFPGRLHCVSLDWPQTMNLGGAMPGLSASAPGANASWAHNAQTEPSYRHDQPDNEKNSEAHLIGRSNLQ